MDTQNSAVTDVPEFKLAKVGKGKRERKRAGAGWFGSKGGSAFSGAFGGSGAGAGAAGALGAAVGGAEGALGFAGMTLTKALLAMLIAGGLGAAAWTIGRSMSSDADGGAAAAKKIFTDKGGQYADTSGVIKGENSLPNSLGYVSGSLDGMTPEERAKKAAADAEAARKAAEEEAAAKKAAEDEAARKEKENASPSGKSAVDPGALAGLDASKMGFGGGKGNNLHGGLSGLGGLNGGRGGLAGGSGLSGGINQGFGGGNLAKGAGGSLSAMKGGSKPTMISAARAAGGKSKAKGFAKRQLDNAFTQSKQAVTAGKTETAASGAAVPFDGTNPGGGTAIGGGPGVTKGGTTTGGTADGGTPTNGGPSGPTGNGNTNTNTDPPPACDVGYNPTQDGVCVKTTTSNPGGHTSYQWMIDLAKKLMTAVTVLAVLALIYALSPWTWGISQIIKTVIATLGGIIGLLGMAYAGASGDMMTGGIVALVGAFTVASAFLPSNIAAVNSSGASAGLAQLAAGAMISTLVGSMATNANAAHLKAADMQ